MGVDEYTGKNGPNESRSLLMPWVVFTGELENKNYLNVTVFHPFFLGQSGLFLIDLAGILTLLVSRITRR